MTIKTPIPSSLLFLFLGLIFQNLAGAALSITVIDKPVTDTVVTASDMSTVSETAPLPPATPSQFSRPPMASEPTTNLISASPTNAAYLQSLELKLKIARAYRRDKAFPEAEKEFISLMEGEGPDDLKREVLLELAMLAKETGQLVRAQQMYSHFLRKFPEDPDVPEIYLRQGLIYREQGAPILAMAKFYSVMSSALNLKLDRLERYQRVVLQAQTEIADTFYLQGRYPDAAAKYELLFKSNPSDLNLETILFKIVRCYSVMEKHNEAVSKAELFFSLYPNSAELPEVRFLAATELKKMGRTQESLEQVLMLLQTQKKLALSNVETWRYWQQRAGNEIANQLYQEKDYLNALMIYTSLADLNKSPSWQFPVLYQIGLVCEQLKQPEKAIESYDRILETQKDLSKDATNATLMAVIDMAQWRKAHLAWRAKAEAVDRELLPAPPASKPAALP